MLYTEYKDLFQFALQSKSPHAVAYLADVGGKIVDSRIRSYTHNVGDILRKIKFLDCSITNINGMEYFDYTSNNIMELNCNINYKNKKVKK